MKTTESLLTQYKKLVIQKYHHYNEIFLTLPYPGLVQSGTALPVFSEYCSHMLMKHETPQQIVTDFFSEILKISEPDNLKKIIMLFLQFIERQIVLFDALEDSSYGQLHDLKGPGSVSDLMHRVEEHALLFRLENILQNYRTRIVLTAHPTQFYPPYAINIIHQLSVALKEDNLDKIQEILLQLGKTSLRNSSPPSPMDEADFLLMQIRASIVPSVIDMDLPIVQLGFWPGGDRDGNPKVTAETSLEVSKRLKNQIMHIYQGEMNDLLCCMTFPGVWEKLVKISIRLKSTRQAIRSKRRLVEKPYSDALDLLEDLIIVKDELTSKHGGLFLERLEKFMRTVHQFGFHYASLDLRENSAAHSLVIDTILQELNFKIPYLTLSHDEKAATIFELLDNNTRITLSRIQDPFAKDTLQSFKNIAKIQKQNGELGMHRYIISHTRSAADVFEVFLLAKWAGLSWKKLSFDVVPLFESIEDLEHAETIMEALWKNPQYQKHLKQRGSQQTIMLGFSDGTKDGGFVAANWSIYQCKFALWNLAKTHELDIIFFDGRGGPPARGGGNTHLFYQALESVIPQTQVHLTIQGQTVSSNFGTPDSAKFNLEQLATAALYGKLFPSQYGAPTENQITLLQSLSDISYESYQNLKNNPLFLSYLTEVTPLEYYEKMNIASRPARRASSSTFADLRAIPFVGAWSQMKQNIPGYFGLGTALQALITAGHLQEFRDLYQTSLYFKTLINNAMMSLKKSNFSVTEYLSRDEKYGEFWKMLRDETQLTIELCLSISKQTKLLENDPLNEQSIALRESIILPLLVLQQYALHELRTNLDLSPEDRDFLQKLILKSLAVNINATRNSV